MTAGYATCQDIGGQFHFKVLIPPWKYNKEYRCSQWVDGECVGQWNPTGRYVFVVSDVPFINYDSEIITSMDVEIVTLPSGGTSALVQNLINTEAVGQTGSNATFYGASTDYPRAVLGSTESLEGHELLWRQQRSFQGNDFNWYRRDTFLRGAGGRVYHLKFFSIESLDKPEFEALISSFREYGAEDGAPHCQCKDEHDPSGSQDC
jgi:hypothetical protein